MGSRGGWGVSLCLGALAAATPAGAAPTEPAPIAPIAASPAAEAPTRWYGWQNALAATPFALTFALSIRKGEDSEGALPLLGLGGYLVASPIVHFAHGNVRSGFASFGLAVGIPLVAALVLPSDCTKDTDDPQRKSCKMELNTLFPPALRWASLLAVAVDAAFLAHEPEGTTTAAAGVVPTLAAGPSSLLVGAAGRF